MLVTLSSGRQSNTCPRTTLHRLQRNNDNTAQELNVGYTIFRETITIPAQELCLLLYLHGDTCNTSSRIICLLLHQLQGEIYDFSPSTERPLQYLLKGYMIFTTSSNRPLQ
jgi:hypothetical protein